MGYKYIVDSGATGGPPAPLHPAASRADWGRSTPGQEEPWGGWRSDGVGELVLKYNRSVFQMVVTFNPVGDVLTLS